MNILGIGECMIELYSAAPIVESTQFTRQVGGDVFNTLVAAQRQGCHCGFLSRIALDGFGQVLFYHVSKEGLDASYLQGVQQGFNGIYFATLEHPGQHRFLYYRQGSAASQLRPEHIKADAIRSAEMLYVSGITQGISPTARQAVLKACQLAKQYGTSVAYDPNYRPALWGNRNVALDAAVELFPYIDVILPSLEDMHQLFGMNDVPHIMEYFHFRDIPMVVLKQAELGVTLGFQRSSQFFPAHSVDLVVDTIGAGDAFNGGFLAGLIQQKSLSDCVQQGLATAAFSVQGSGPIRSL